MADRKRTVRRGDGKPKNARYDQEAKDKFIELALEIGVAPAVDQLGYPSLRQSYDWVRDAGVKIEVDYLRQRSRNFREFYSTQEKLTLANDMVRAISHKLRVSEVTGEFIDTRLTPQDIGRLATAYERAVKIVELLEGRPTDITENVTVGGLDAELRALIDETKRENDAQVAKIQDEL